MSELRVLTVCTGNLCRSPAAAVLLSAAVREAGLHDRIEVGSAGTSWEAEGMPMDERTAEALARAGFTEHAAHTARSIHLSELQTWDLALAMTTAQASTLERIAEQIPDDLPQPQIRCWREFDPKLPVDAEGDELDVPDPWYQGQREFDRMVRVLQRSLPSLIVELRSMLDRDAVRS